MPPGALGPYSPCSPTPTTTNNQKTKRVALHCKAQNRKVLHLLVRSFGHPLLLLTLWAEWSVKPGAWNLYRCIVHAEAGKAMNSLTFLSAHTAYRHHSMTGAQQVRKGRESLFFSTSSPVQRWLAGNAMHLTMQHS